MRKPFIAGKQFWIDPLDRRVRENRMKRAIPLVGIGLPVYNGERFLTATLDSILAQTFKDFELIISDNGSTDKTQEICVEYSRRDSRIRYIRQEINLGASRNYNLVFEMTAGKYFRWAAADDLFSADSLEKCVATLEKYPEAVLCYPKTTLIDQNGQTIRLYEDQLDLRFPNASDRFREALHRIGMVNVLYGLIRSDMLRKTSLMGNYPGTDMALLAELTLYGQFFEIPHHLFFRRMHPQAFSSITTLKEEQEFFDPKMKTKIILRSWRHLYQHFVSIGRAPLGLTGKVQCAKVAIRTGISSRHELLKEISDAVGMIFRRSFFFRVLS